MRSLPRIPLIAIIPVIGLTFGTCKNPIGLGSTVDISAPVIAIDTEKGAGPGSFITGKEKIYIDVTDDSGPNGIDSVMATYSYNDPDGNIVTKTVRASYDAKADRYYIEIDSESDDDPIPDGILKVIISAKDKSGKQTISPELIYTVKNNPPQISMQIPRPRVELNELNQENIIISPAPEAVTNNYLMGVFEDLAGVARDYPQIKIWKHIEGDETEPMTYNANAGWERVSSYTHDPGDGWVFPDEGYVESEKGERGGTFRYWLRNRDAGGKRFENDSVDIKCALDTGKYRIKLRAMDITGNIIEWPKDSFANKPDYMLIELINQGTPPDIREMYPVDLYQRSNFTVEARAFVKGESDIEIKELTITANAYNRLGENKQIILRRESGNLGDGAKIEFPVEVGKTCYEDNGAVLIVDNEEDVPQDAFYLSFIDGSYDFTITAMSDSGSEGKAYLSLYIDRIRPITTISTVTPFYSQDQIFQTLIIDEPNNEIHDYNEIADTYRRWTVNSTIQISAGFTDNRGDATDTETGYVKFKYFFLKNNDVDENDYIEWKSENTEALFGDYLYNRSDAVFFNHTEKYPHENLDNGNPLIKVNNENGIYTITLQTHKWDEDAAIQPYKLWFYIIAMDNAGNTGYQKILLNINQETDIPIMELDTPDNAYINENHLFRLGLSDDNGIKPYDIEYRFAKNNSEKSAYIANPENGWTILVDDPDPLSPSLLNQSVILSLQKIEFDFNGLGSQADSKWIQFRAKDDIDTKVYLSDGVVYGYGEQNFIIDLSAPVIIPSLTDLQGNAIERDDENPFIQPEKSKIYRELDYISGDLIEYYLKSITVKIDSDSNKYIPDDLPDSAPVHNDFAVWKIPEQDNIWDGALRWRVPVQYLADGSHFIEISFEDALSRITSHSLTFYIDSSGPAINLTIPGAKVFLSDDDLEAIAGGNTEGITDYGNIGSIFNIISTKLMGNFTDDLSAIGEGYYKIDGISNNNTVIDYNWEPFVLGDGESKFKNWDIILPEDIPDGIYRLNISITDILGNTRLEENLGFFIDSQSPVIKDLNDPGTTNSTLIINGKIEHTYQEPDWSIAVNDNKIPDENVICTQWASTGEAQVFNFELEISLLTNGEDDAIIPVSGINGSNAYSITINAIKGEKSAIAVRNFIFDTDPPEITLRSPLTQKIYLNDTELDAINSNTIDSISGLYEKYAALFNMSINDSSAIISGNFVDEYSNVFSLDNAVYYYSIDDGSWESVLISNPYDMNKRSSAWQIPLPNLPNGIHLLNIRVKDTLGNGYDNEDINPDGNIGFGYETNLAFMVDAHLPVISIPDDGSNNWLKKAINNDFIINGTISNTFSIKRLIVKLDGIEINEDAITLAGQRLNNGNITDGTCPALTQSFDFTVDVAAAAITHGTHTLTISAIGSSYLSAMEVCNVIIDREGPNISFNTPITKKYYSGIDTEAHISGSNTITDLIARISGNFTDLYSDIFTIGGNDKFYYQIDGSSYENNGGTLTEIPGGWYEVIIPISETDKFNSQSVSWTILLNQYEAEDGFHSLSIRVKDSLGNGYGIGIDDDTAINALGLSGGNGFETRVGYNAERKVPAFRDGVKGYLGTTTLSTPLFINQDFIINGTIYNTSGIQELSVQINNGVPDIITAGAVLDTIINELPNGDFELMYPLSVSALGSDGSYSVTVSVTGASGYSTMAVLNFTYDTKAPEVLFNAPSVGIELLNGQFSGDINGTYKIVYSDTSVTGQTKIGGTSDDENGIAKIYYHLGRLNDDTAANDAARMAIYSNPVNWTNTNLDGSGIFAEGWTGGLYYWNFSEGLNNYQFNEAAIEKGGTSISLPGLPVLGGNIFYLPLYVKIEDRAGNFSIVQYKIKVDPDMDFPIARFSTPVDGTTVGGEIRVSGTANDNNWVHSVEIRIADNSSGTPVYYYEDDWLYPGDPGWILANIQGNTDTFVSWYYNINSAGELNPEQGQTARHILIEVRAIDTKDPNHLDPDLTGDVVSIGLYFNAGVPTVSVPVITKNLDIIWKGTHASAPSDPQQNWAYYNSSNHNWYFRDSGTWKLLVDTRFHADGIRASGKFKLMTTVKDDGGIDQLNVRQTGQTNFMNIIYKDEVINQSWLSDQNWNVTPPAEIPQNEWVPGYRYKVVNPGSVSNWADFDASGTSSFSAGNIFRYKYGGTPPNGSGATAYRAEGIQAVDNDDLAQNYDTQLFEFHLEMIIDSVNLPNLGYGKTGTFALELQVYDNNSPPYNTNALFAINIDNFYPTAEIFTQYNVATARSAVMGEARDYDGQSGTVQGLERMLVYFQRGANYYNGKGEINTGMTSRVNVLDVDLTPTPYTGYTPNVANFANFPVLYLDGEVWKSEHAMVIDKEFEGDGDLDGDGTFDEIFAKKMGTQIIEWGARFNTMPFNDGLLKVHYILMDLAGNATHYVREVYVGNNRPLIREISLATDINGSGSISDGTGSTLNEYIKSYIVGEVSGETKNRYERIFAENFRIRNSLFGIKVNALYGNDGKNYHVSYVKRSDDPLSAHLMEQGKVYSIAEPKSTAWTKYGSPNNSSGAVFIATGPAVQTFDVSGMIDTTGTVWEYTPDDVNTETQIVGRFIDTGYGVTPDDTTVIHAFEDFTNIPDSEKTFGVVNGNDRYFLINVFDTTIDSVTEDSVYGTDTARSDNGWLEKRQLSHMAVIALSIDNDDEKPPLISIEPFYWNNATDNSLFQNNKAYGHIELENDLPSSFNDANGIKDRDPKVSGKISFQGSAFDNGTIEKIYFNIDGHASLAVNTLAAELLLGEWVEKNGAGWDFKIVKERFNGTDRAGIDDNTLEAIYRDGHYIEWRLDYDSSSGTVAGGAKADYILTIIAEDMAENDSAPSGTSTWSDDLQTRAEAKTEHYRFDVVPYISDISTTVRSEGGLKPNNIRSADGRYSVIQGNNSNFITVSGFNLNPISTGVRVQTEAQKSEYNPGILSGTNLTFNAPAPGYTSFTMSNNSDKSGYLTVWGGTGSDPIGSLNNINNNNAQGAYRFKLSTNDPVTGVDYEFLTGISNGSDEENMPNRETDRSVTKNITLTDDRYLQFFKVLSAKTTWDVGVPSYPDMIMVEDNPVFGYLNSSGAPSTTGNGLSSTTAGASPGTGAGNNPGNAWPQRREVDGIDGAEKYTEFLIKASSWDGMGMTRDDSGRFLHATTYARDGGTFHIVYDRFAELYTVNNSGWGCGTGFAAPSVTAPGAATADATAVALEPTGYGDSLGIYRYQYPKLYSKGNSNSTTGAAFYMFYYDDVLKEVVFRNFRIGSTTDTGSNRLRHTNGTAVTDTTQSTHNVSAASINNYINIARYSGTFNATSTGATTTTLNGTTNGGNTRHAAVSGDSASKYFDFGVTNDNYVVLICYDQSNSKLKLQYSSNARDGSSPTTAPGWTNSTLNFPEYIGRYVSMVLDGNALHIAALNDNDFSLQYIYIGDYRNGQSGNTLKSVKVDSHGNVGSWAQIKLHPDTKRPYISYFNLSEVGTRDSVKIAFPFQDIVSADDVLPGVDINDYTTGSWEYITMPSLNPPDGGNKEFQKVNLGFRSTDKQPVLGYLSDKAIEFGYPIGE